MFSYYFPVYVCGFEVFFSDSNSINKSVYRQGTAFQITCKCYKNKSLLLLLLILTTAWINERVSLTRNRLVSFVLVPVCSIYWSCKSFELFIGGISFICLFRKKISQTKSENKTVFEVWREEENLNFFLSHFCAKYNVQLCCDNNSLNNLLWENFIYVIRSLLIFLHAKVLETKNKTDSGRK